MNKTLSFIVSSVLCGTLLGLYSILRFPVSMIASLAVIFIGIRFFKNFESVKMRIGFIASAVVIYFIFIIVLAFVNYIRDHPIPV